jgi:hypothetical protein
MKNEWNGHSGGPGRPGAGKSVKEGKRGIWGSRGAKETVGTGHDIHPHARGTGHWPGSRQLQAPPVPFMPFLSPGPFCHPCPTTDPPFRPRQPACVCFEAVGPTNLPNVTPHLLRSPFFKIIIYLFFILFNLFSRSL